MEDISGKNESGQCFSHVESIVFFLKKIDLSDGQVIHLTSVHRESWNCQKERVENVLLSFLVEQLYCGHLLTATVVDVQ